MKPTNMKLFAREQEDNEPVLSSKLRRLAQYRGRWIATTSFAKLLYFCRANETYIHPAGSSIKFCAMHVFFLCLFCCLKCSSDLFFKCVFRDSREHYKHIVSNPALYSMI